MTKPRDPFDTIVALRPRTTVDRAWPPAERAVVHERVVAAEVAGRAAAPRRWTRRATVIALVTGALIPVGVGVAGAGGMLPGFSRYYAEWKTDAGVDPATATRAGTAPGPDGTVFAVWTAKGRGGNECFAPLFESAQSAARPDPSAFEGSGSSCRPVGLVEPFGSSAAVNGDDAKATYMVSAGDTARAELTLADGTRQPALRVAGSYFGWYPLLGGDRTAVLIAYDGRGAVAGEHELSLPGPPD